MQISGRNATSALEDATTQLRAGMETARRGGESLPQLRAIERQILRTWAFEKDRLFQDDPTLKLERRQGHGEHVVGFDPVNSCWWKMTHPGTTGVGAEFVYDSFPPFEIHQVNARELLPSEYLFRLILHNLEFGDDIRLEGYVDQSLPSLVISQPDIAGAPASQEQMEKQMLLLGFRPLSGVRLGKPCSISFYHPDRRIALFDAHPGNFFHTPGGTLPIDCILSKIQQPTEHAWLMDRVAPNY